ncbi:MAG TPA: hypothetical protein VII75_04340 [Thermoanaerobaculia bacterium]
MTINCERLDDLLYEGDAASLALAETHAAQCRSCREKLDDWNDISVTAKSMHVTWQNDMLWPRIQRSLKPSFQWMRIAAAIIVTVGISASVFYAMHVRSAQQKAYDQAILRTNAIEDVERAEKVHIDAINKLEKIAAPKLEEPQTPILVSYKEKLMLLDDAIAECQSNIDQNRNNAQVRKQLLAMYSEKQKTLHDVLREGDHVPNP